MNIAIDIAPIDSSSKSEHKVRGVGKYITILRDNIEKFDTKNSYIFTSNPKDLKNGIDIIHYPYFDPFFITLPFRNSTATLVTVHDIIPLVHKKAFPVGFKGNIKWNYNKLLLKRVDGIITDSYASKEDIHKVVGISENKIYPVHLAVDDEFSPRKLSDTEKEKLYEKYNLPQTYLLYVGDVTWNKNLPRIIKATQNLGIPLVMVGSALADEEFDQDSPWNRDRKIVLEKTRNNPLFLKLGFVPIDDLVKIYNLAQALLMVSLDEGFGLPVLEAMKSGCPVITSNCGSLAEVAGDVAVYVDAEDIQSIEQGIKQVVNSLALQEELSKKGFVQAEKFSLEKLIKNTVKVYEMIAHEKQT